MLRVLMMEATCVLLGNQQFAKQYGLNPKAKVIGIASAGVEAKYMGIGPVPAVQKVLKQTGLSLEQMDVIELNEAFLCAVTGSDS